VQDVYGTLESDGVNGAKGVASMVLHNFENSCAIALPRLGVGMFPPNCAIPNAAPRCIRTASGKRRRSFFEEPTQNSGFSPAAGTSLVMLYSSFRI
jgi:hypothetical protein